jgi:uncharacterized protein with GYD domain
MNGCAPVARPGPTSPNRIPEEVGALQRYLTLYRYTADAWQHIAERQLDRPQAVAHMLEQAGGKLVEMYWMFGPYDGVVIVDAPDENVMMAIKIICESTGNFSLVQFHPLIKASEHPAVVENVRGVTFLVPSHPDAPTHSR